MLVGWTDTHRNKRNGQHFFFFGNLHTMRRKQGQVKPVFDMRMEVCVGMTCFHLDQTQLKLYLKLIETWCCWQDSWFSIPGHSLILQGKMAHTRTQCDFVNQTSKRLLLVREEETKTTSEEEAGAFVVQARMLSRSVLVMQMAL